MSEDGKFIRIESVRPNGFGPATDPKGKRKSGPEKDKKPIFRNRLNNGKTENKTDDPGQEATEEKKTKNAGPETEAETENSDKMEKYYNGNSRLRSNRDRRRLLF